jgi:hypothetical protein
MIKVKGSSRLRLAALAHSKKVLRQQQLFSEPEVVFQAAERFRTVPVQPPKTPVARIEDVLGDFSEQTGASFG